MSRQPIINTIANIPAGFPYGYECFFITANQHSKLNLNISVGQLPSRQDLDVSCFIVTKEDFEKWSAWVDLDKSKNPRPDIRMLFHRKSSAIQDIYQFTESREYVIVVDNTYSAMTPKRVWAVIFLE